MGDDISTNVDTTNAGGESIEGNEFDMSAAVEEVSNGLGLELVGTEGESSTGKDNENAVEANGDNEEEISSGINDTDGKEKEEKSSTTENAATIDKSDKPPVTWRKEAAAEWNSLSSTLKSEINKREQDILSGIEGYKQLAGIGTSVRDIIKPHIGLLQSNNINPLELISGLVQSHIQLATADNGAKMEIFKQLAENYGIDGSAVLNTTDNGEPPYADPQIKSLQDEISSLKSKLNGFEEQSSTDQRNKIIAKVKAFAEDPKNIYWSEVASDVAGLIKSGTAKDLTDAYEKAVWANPITREKEQARLKKEAEEVKQQEAKKQAKKAAKTTNTNMKAKQRTNSNQQPLGTMDDTLKETLADIKKKR